MAKPVTAQAIMLARAAGTVGPRPKAVCANAHRAVDEVVVNGRKLTRDQARCLQQAAELAKGNAVDRGRAAAMVRDVQRDLDQAAEADAIASGVAETVELMGGLAAGYRVEEELVASFVRDERGCLVRHEGELVVRAERVKRVRRDDGLANLFKSGALTQEQYEVGQLYRIMSAKAAPSARSSLAERSGGGATGTSDRAVWAALDQAYAALRLRLVRQAIADERAFMVLDAVAGRGEVIRALGNGGNAWKKNAARLAASLDEAGRWLRISDAQLKKAVANRER